MNEHDHSFVDRLREIIEYEGLTRRELFELTGIKKDRWDNLFKKLTQPRVAELRAICRLMPEYKMYLSWGEEEPTVGQVSPATKASLDKAAKSMNEESHDLAFKYTLMDSLRSHHPALPDHALLSMIKEGQLDEVKRHARAVKGETYTQSLAERGNEITENLKTLVPNIEVNEAEQVQLARLVDYLTFLKKCY